MKPALALLLGLGLIAGQVNAQVAFDEEAVDGVFTEPDLALQRGRALLKAGRVEDAIEAFRAAGVEGGDRAAAVQYNVARALADDAARGLEAAKKDAPPGQPPEVPAEVKERLQQAAEAFERAYELGQGTSMRSQAAQAAGNAWVGAQELPRAIEQYRRALVADPSNEAARRNLARALRYLRAAAPPPPSSGGEDDQDQEDQGDQEQQEQQQDGQKNDDEQKNQQQGEQEQKDQQGQQQQQQPDPNEKKPDEKPQPQPQEKQGGDEQEEQKGARPEEKPGEKGDEKGKAKTRRDQDKERARQILDAMRSRERPLNPQLMREPAGDPPRSGKDW